MLVLKPYIIMHKAHDQYIEGRRLPPSSFDQHTLLLAGMRGGTKNLTTKSTELECLGLLRSIFFGFAPIFLAKRFQLHALRSKKNGGVVRAHKRVLHRLQFFMELLHSGVCGAVPDTPLVQCTEFKMLHVQIKKCFNLIKNV